MKRFVKAVGGMKSTVIYTDTDGRHFRFSGGTWTWRNHNPGNVYAGPISARHNRIGETHAFAIFPSHHPNLKNYGKPLNILKGIKLGKLQKYIVYLMLKRLAKMNIDFAEKMVIGYLKKNVFDMQNMRKLSLRYVFQI